jgi:aryl-alcohol dehydrogenase-like predicted oxidoreductase
VFLAGKARFPVGVTARDAGLSRRRLRRALDASLARLGVDHIDLYQLHAWDPLTPIEESLDFLADAVWLGKISYAGISNFTGWQTATAAAYARGRLPLVSAQPQYSLLTREYHRATRRQPRRGRTGAVRQRGRRVKIRAEGRRATGRHRPGRR